MKFLNYALCAVAGIFAFSSCTKAEVEKIAENRSLTININNDTTRAEDEPIAGAVKSDYSSLYIYLTDGTNVVSSDVITAADAITEFKTKGKAYDNISASVSKVLVVANVKAGDAVPVPAGTPVADIKGFAFALASQQPDNVNAVENTKSGGLQVTMIGEAALTDTGNTTPEGDKKMTAAITLTPIVARVELSGNLSRGDGIHNIGIDQLYLNGYHADYSFQNIVDSGINIDNYVSNLQNAAYGTNMDIQKGTKADAYHLFANNTNGNMPHVVLKVSGSFANADGTQGADFNNKYLTVTKFTDPQGNNIEKISPNSIYKINLSLLTVPASVLDPTPEAGRISLDVTVDVAEWNVVNVTPEI